MSEFTELIEQMTDEQFWTWVKTWYDEQHILDTINNWDDETKEEELDTMKKIMKVI